MERNELVGIFGKDMLDDKEIIPILDELTGKADIKPFECVGTPDEVNAALNMYNGKIENAASRFNELISEYNDENLLPEEFETILKKALNG